MKSFLKRLSRRLFSLVLCAVMVVGTFLGVGPVVSFKAEAAEGDVTIGGITQTRVVGDYASKYRAYQKRFFKGEETNWPTEFVIPGLSEDDYYTPQGMTYWKAKEWILISAYDAYPYPDEEKDKTRNSVIYALDATTTKMVAVFRIWNSDGSVNTSHGGGIAASEYNFYYADSGSKISYVPLSEMDVDPTQKSDPVYDIKLKDSVDLKAELNGVATSYCCYDEGVLWTGNFYIASDSNYNKKFSDDYAQALMGYRLKGNSSAEEWDHLENGSLDTTTDRHVGAAGDPSYVILLDIDKIQYAMVDKGKIYISRSWSRYESANHARELVIGDMDLTKPGDATKTINGVDRPVHIVKYADNVAQFGGDGKEDSGKAARNTMPFMGEALCVIDDYLYMFTEGAAWAYNGEDGFSEAKNYCAEPIDVIWKIDQYAIQELERPAEDVPAVEYEPVKSLTQINPDDEYIIFYESSLKDPITQDNILYLLDAYGGYGDTKLPKKSNPNNANEITQPNTGDTLGMVGYKISDYSVNAAGNLVISQEDDANMSIRWQFEETSGFGNAAGTLYNLMLKNRSLYYTKNPYFYMGDRLFAMTTNAYSGMKIAGWNNGEFVIYGGPGGGFNLWCNDGSVADSITKYSNHYKNHGISDYTPNYHNLDEVPGTFHANNTALPATAVSHQQGLHIYKRVSDPFGSVVETNVYTDMKAELQSDGTYNIVVETYATNNLQYQRAKDKRPIDYIFVLDSSGLMDGKDCPEWVGHNTTMKAHNIGGGDSSGSSSIYGQDGVEGWKDGKYYKAPDGEYYEMCITATEMYKATVGCDKVNTQEMWIYYTDKNDQRYYYNDETKEWSADVDSQLVTGGDTATRAKVDVYDGPYYEITKIERIDAVKKAVSSFANKIAADANSSGLDHRMALVTFGSDGTGDPSGQEKRPWKNTGMYTNDGNFVQYDAVVDSTYDSAFFRAKDQASTFTTAVNKMTKEGHNYPSYGLQMASKIIDNSDYKYDINGTRSAAVIVISSGAPGYITKADHDDTVTLNTANGALGEGGAYSLKRNGAHIYTALLGNGVTSGDFNLNADENFERDFMKYLSSDYTGSKSMSDPGPVNDRENASYYFEFSDGTSFQYDKIAESIVKNVNVNSNVTISSLDNQSILRERISDAFNLGDSVSVTCELAQSKYDGVGRLYFGKATDAPETVKAELDGHDLKVTGFHYSDNNVSEYNSAKGNGNKLIVTIKGVTADPSKTLTSAPINDTTYTALYESEDRMENNQALKKFQQYYFAIPEYTYYMDYGIPMLDKDVNGTLVSVDSAPQKQSTYKPSWSTDNMGIKFTEDKQDLIYTLNSQGALTVDDSRGYVLIQRDDGTYDWFRLNIVPASTVYYEENRLKSLGGNYTEWDQNGSPDDFTQSLSSKDDVFGQDSVYIGRKDDFSLGTNKKVTVSESNNRSQTETFTFTGTGFDLYSACGNNTGIQTVTVRNASTNELVKVYMVDTYYNDSTYNTLYQVPIVQFKTDTLATYKVEVTAAYYSFAGGIKAQSTDTLEIEGTDIEATSAVADIPSTDELFAQVGMDELIGQEVEVIWMDENSIFNGGTGAGNMDITLQGDIGTSTNEKKLDNYIDGFRIYNTDTYDNEYIESEKNASYYSVIDAITKGNMGGDGENLVAYIEPGATGDLTFGNYLEKGGPKYEVYLAADQSIAFRFKATNENVRAMISIRAASGTATAKIKGKEFAVNNATETYFDITNYLGSKDEDGCYTVTITNTGTGLLAVDNIKLTNAELSPLNGASLVTLNSLISMPSVEVDPFEKQPETFDFVQAPADNPFIDPEGSIPDIDEIGGTDGSTEEPVKNFFDIVVDFFRNVIERIKEVLQALPVFWTKAK